MTQVVHKQPEQQARKFKPQMVPHFQQWTVYSVINCEQRPPREEAEAVAVDFGQSLNLFSSGNRRAKPRMHSLGISADQEHTPCIPSVLSSNFQNAYSFPSVEPNLTQKKIVSKQPAT